MQYHDEEWGRPVYDDQLLFEMLCLEGAQAGLSWITVLRKRKEYMRLFSDFDFVKITTYTDKQLEQILFNPGIIRNRLKVYGVRKNAFAAVQIVKEWGSLSKYLWSFVKDKPVRHSIRTRKDYISTSPESDALSKSLKSYGATFIGSTICYAFMQACGMVNDHAVGCAYR
jgi:DNA-3-methyladenine glycosylase I